MGSLEANKRILDFLVLSKNKKKNKQNWTFSTVKYVYGGNITNDLNMTLFSVGKMHVAANNAVN